MRIRIEIPYIPDLASDIWSSFSAWANRFFVKYEDPVLFTSLGLVLLTIVGFSVDRLGLLGTLGLYVVISMTGSVLLIALLTGRFWLPKWALRMIERWDERAMLAIHRHLRA
ncbi:MAG: hypothetical protein AAB519_01250 [Patescibacteria group bacterium]